MTPTLRKAEAAAPHPCSACPWRTANQGQRHPGGWYTKANLRRLWTKLRDGDAMTCHPTDPENPLPPGFDPVPEGATLHECTGALILQFREVHIMNFLTTEELGGSRAYRQMPRRGMTVNGLATMVTRFIGWPGTQPIPRDLNLNEPGIGYDQLPWEPRRWRQ